MSSCQPLHATGSGSISCLNVGANLVTVGVALNSTGCSLTVASGTSTFTRAPHGPALLASMGAAYIFYFSYTTAPGNISILITPSGCSGAVIDAWADVFSGAVALDTDATGVSSTGTSINTPTLTPSSTNEAVFNACLAGGNISSALAPWSMDPISNGNDAAWAIVSSAQPVGYTQSGGSGWACAEAAFR